MNYAGIAKLKEAFLNTHDIKGHLNEVVPLKESDTISIKEKDLRRLHEFAQHNPIYTNWQETVLLDIPCYVYEADINQYWLDSIKHDSSFQSFYPTWLLSAFAIADIAKRLGCEEVLDIGAGDGRIPYCAKFLGLKAHGFEIDEGLVRLHQKIIQDTKVRFESHMSDVSKFDFKTLELSKPFCVISGLPEMGGEMLAESVIPAMSKDPIRDKTAFLLMGKDQQAADNGHGWSEIIKRFGLTIKEVIWLPSHWTTEQQTNTPHVLASF